MRLLSFVLFRWDNGEREKMSPWDMEPIPDEGWDVEHACGTLNMIISHYNTLTKVSFTYTECVNFLYS